MLCFLHACSGRWWCQDRGLAPGLENTASLKQGTGRGSLESLRSGRCLTDWAREQLAESLGADMFFNIYTEGCCLPQ